VQTGFFAEYGIQNSSAIQSVAIVLQGASYRLAPSLALRRDLARLGPAL